MGADRFIECRQQTGPGRKNRVGQSGRHLALKVESAWQLQTIGTPCHPLRLDNRPDQATDVDLNLDLNRARIVVGCEGEAGYFPADEFLLD